VFVTGRAAGDGQQAPFWRHGGVELGRGRAGVFYKSWFPVPGIF
jgi:hypothetical protein